MSVVALSVPVIGEGVIGTPGMLSSAASVLSPMSGTRSGATRGDVACGRARSTVTVAALAGTLASSSAVATVTPSMAENRFLLIFLNSNTTLLPARAPVSMQ